MAIVRRPALESFRAQKPPTGEQWLSRQGWSPSKWKVKAGQGFARFYRPAAGEAGASRGRYRQDYPRWAAELDTGPSFIGGWTYPTYQGARTQGLHALARLHRIPRPAQGSSESCGGVGTLTRGAWTDAGGCRYQRFEDRTSRPIVYRRSQKELKPP